MNILEAAELHFPNAFFPSADGTYRTSDERFDSVVLYVNENRYFRFSNWTSGGVWEFLRYVVGLSDAEATATAGKRGKGLQKSLRSVLRSKHQKTGGDTAMSILDVIGTRGNSAYNDYVEKRRINADTAVRHGLETDGVNTIFPLYDIKGRRIGSQIRYRYAKTKGDRYRTHMVGTNAKPSAWPLPALKSLESDSVVILVEGNWSRMRVSQVMEPLLDNIVVISTMGTNLDEDLMIYLNGHNIIAIIDDDNGGNEVKAQLIKYARKGYHSECYIPTNIKGESVYVDDINDNEMKNLFRVIWRVTKFKLKIKGE